MYFQSGGTLVRKGVEFVGAWGWNNPGLTSSVLGDRWGSYSEIYRSQLWVSVLVNKLAKAQARLPLKVYLRTADGGRDEAGDHPYARLLRNPSSRHDPFTFYAWTAATEAVFGAVAWGKIRDTGGRPVELVLFHPAGLSREERDGRTWWTFRNGRVEIKDIPAHDIVFFHTYNPDDPSRGMSPLEPLRATLENEDAARRATSSFWRNGARPGVALSHPGNLSQGAMDRLKLQWNQVAAGADRTGSTVVLEEGMKPEILTVNNEEAQYVETRRLNREECCAAYDVPPPVVHILDRATFCLPAETMVSTGRGPVSVSDVVESDVVFGFDGKGLVPGKVSWSGQTGVEPVYTIRTANRTIRATGNHPFLVARRPHIGGAGNRTRYGTAEYVYVPAEALTAGDLLVSAHGYADAHGTDVAPNGRTVDESFMEFAGLLMGDGWVSPAGVSLAHADGARYIEHYLHCAAASFTQRDGALSFNRDGRSTRFSSASASRELRELGFGGTAHTKRVPGWVFGLGPDLRLAFLRGFFEADGSVDKKGRMSFTLCNLLMVQQVRDMCIGLGVPVTNLRTVTRESILPGGKSFTGTHHTFTATDPGANALIGSWDPQDTERICSGKSFATTYYTYADRAGRAIPAPSGTQLARISEITFDPTPVPVYDLTVDELHSFVADGLVVHNSNITEQMRSMYRDTMSPRLSSFESVLESELRATVRPGSSDPDFGDDVYAEYLLDEVLRGDFEVRADALQKAINSGQLTPNEARRLENRPALPGGDVLLVNAAMMPLGERPAAEQVPAVEPSLRWVEAEVVDVDDEPIPQPLARKVMGRLSRPKAPADVDAEVLADGLPLTHQVALWDAQLRSIIAGEDMPALRARVGVLAGKGEPGRDELAELRAEMRTGFDALAAKVAAAPAFNLSLPERMVTLDYHAAPVEVKVPPVNVDVAPAQVHVDVPPPPLREKIVQRNERGEIVRTVERDVS